MSWANARPQDKHKAGGGRTSSSFRGGGLSFRGRVRPKTLYVAAAPQHPAFDRTLTPHVNSWSRFARDARKHCGALSSSVGLERLLRFDAFSG